MLVSIDQDKLVNFLDDPKEIKQLIEKLNNRIYYINNMRLSDDEKAMIGKNMTTLGMIEVIKMFRDRVGCSLFLARSVCEKYRDSLGNGARL